MNILSNISISSPILAILLLAVSHISTVIYAEKIQVGVGDEICIAGYIMDYYCIERGTLFDNQSVRTLGSEGPVVHSVHCLIDVKSCWQSPYEVLMKLENSGEYGRAWRLDDNDDVISHAKANGVCTECEDGNSVDGGNIKNGYRITMKAQVTSLGEAGSTPATIKIQEIHDFENFDDVCEGKQYEVPNMILESDGTSGGGGRLSFNSKVILHGSLMLVGWGFLLPLGAIVAKFGKHRTDAWWFKFHRTIQPLGLLVAIISWIYALVNFTALGAKGVDTLHYPHAVCGITTMVIGSLQPLNAFVRPHPVAEGERKTSIRVAWEIMHKGLGWVCILLALVTIGMGITLLPPDNTQVNFKISFGSLLGIVVTALVFLVIEGARYEGRKLPEQHKNRNVVQEL